MSVATTPSVVQDIVDSADERELWIVSKEFERPPYWFADEGLNARLIKALRVVQEERITPNSDGFYTVEGREGHTYRVREHCSCPDGTHRKERPCYHAVAVTLYTEWQRRLGFTPQGLPLGSQVLASHPDDETLGNGSPVDDATLPLPLPPTSIDERLAHTPMQSWVVATPDRTTAHLPQEEDRMPDDDAQYIPEPDAPGVAVEDPPAPATLPPLRIPKEYTVSIHGRVHVLYTGLVMAAQAHGLQTLAADWTYNDAELSLAHAVCTFADGRRYEESGDATPSNVSKGIAAHFRRVALTRAKARCLRDALGISECSVEELEEDTGKRETPDMTREPSTQALRQRIWQLVKQHDPTIRTRDQVALAVRVATQLELDPDNYAQIVARLEMRA